MLDEEQIEYYQKYKYSTISESVFSKLFEKAKKSLNFDEALHEFIMNYLEKNMNFEIMQNYLELLEINENFSIEKMTYFLQFLNDTNYTLTNEDIINLLELSIFDQFFSSLLQNPDSLFLDLNDLNFKNLYNSYLDRQTKEVEESFEYEKEEYLSEIDFNNSIKIYLRETKKIPILSKEEEIELAKKKDRGDQEARKKLIEHNLRLVISIAKDFIGKGLPISDLIQEGNEGLLKAVDYFDYKRGVRFSTFANKCIRKNIINALKNKVKTIHLPDSIERKIFKINQEKKLFTLKYGYEPSIEELARLMNMNPKEIHTLLRLDTEPISLNTFIGEEQNSTLEDYIVDDKIASPEDVVIAKFLKNDVNALLTVLTAREKEVIGLRFGLVDGKCYKLEEVGKKFHVTAERIRQIEEASLHKLRNSSYAKKLKYYILDDESNDKEEYGMKGKLLELQKKYPSLNYYDWLKLIEQLPINFQEVIRFRHGPYLMELNQFKSDKTESSLKYYQYYRAIKLLEKSAKNLEETYTLTLKK